MFIGGNFFFVEIVLMRNTSPTSSALFIRNSDKPRKYNSNLKISTVDFDVLYAIGWSLRSELDSFLSLCAIFRRICRKFGKNQSNSFPKEEFPPTQFLPIDSHSVSNKNKKFILLPDKKSISILSYCFK